MAQTNYPIQLFVNHIGREVSESRSTLLVCQVDLSLYDCALNGACLLTVECELVGGID